MHQSASLRRAASYVMCLVSTALAILASLLATAQATTFACRRVSIERITFPKPVVALMGTLYDRTGALDEQTMQMLVAALADST